MATRCPDCAYPSTFRGHELGDTKFLARCPRCGGVWRPAGGGTSLSVTEPERQLPGALGLLPERDGIVIDNIGAGFEAPPPLAVAPRQRRRRVGGRYGLHGLAALAIGAGVLGAALTLRAPIVAAFPELGAIAGLPSDHSALVFGDLKSRSLRINGRLGLVVSGEIANRTGRAVAVPAVRVSLRAADGGEVYSWLVEPSMTELEGGDKVGFRSVLGTAPATASEVLVSFDKRRPGPGVH